MKLINATVLSNVEIVPNIFCMEISTPAITVHAGQFLMIYLDSGELLLPRPISICDASKYTLTLVYQVVGQGTKLMAEMTEGQEVRLIAPLGKGFFTAPANVVAGVSPRPTTAMDMSKMSMAAEPTIGADGVRLQIHPARSSLKHVALVGGGIGTPPLLLLAKTLKAQSSKVDVYLGFRTSPILINEFKNIADSVFIATDDGSAGHHGNIIEVLKNSTATYSEFLACGPRLMLDALSSYAISKNIPCQLSMEERMACGLGTCVGCVLKVNGTHLRICTEGPVFYADEVTKHE